jgi:hypothetical protein
MTDPVLGNTYGVDQSVFADIARSTDAPYIIKREGKGAQAVIGPARQFAQIRCRGAVGAGQF